MSRKFCLLSGYAIAFVAIVAPAPEIRAADRDNQSRNQQNQNQSDDNDRNASQNRDRDTSDDVSYHGKERAALGVTLSERDGRHGVRIREVASDSPAEQAGLREGDHITQIDSHTIHSYRDIIRYINGLQPDQTATVVVMRDGNETSYRVTLASRDKLFGDEERGRSRQSRDDYARQNDRQYRQSNDSKNDAQQGDTRRYQDRRRDNEQPRQAMLGVELRQNDEGKLVIKSIHRDGPADRAGLRREDELLSIDDHKVSDRGDVREQLAHHQPGDRIEVAFSRDGQQQTAHLRLDASDNEVSSRQSQYGYTRSGFANGRFRRGENQNGRYDNGDSFADRRGRQSYQRWSINHDHPSLGVTLREDDDGYLSVSRVINKGPADEAGLHTQDEIIAVDNRRVQSVSDILRSLASKQIDDQVTLQVRRNGRTRNVDVTLGSSDKIFSTARNTLGREEERSRDGIRDDRRQDNEDRDSSDPRD